MRRRRAILKPKRHLKAHFFLDPRPTGAASAYGARLEYGAAAYGLRQGQCFDNYGRLGNRSRVSL